MRTVAKAISRFHKEQRGISLVETLVAVAILGVIAVVFINGLTTAYKAGQINDEQTTAESIAQSQMEWVRNASYEEEATAYSQAPLPDDSDYVNYTVVITAEPLHSPDDGLQKITVTVSHLGKQIIQLESYKRQP
jgi:prepilin-type N-terminal cleavage/methylation domain-containing protein